MSHEKVVLDRVREIILAAELDEKGNGSPVIKPLSSAGTGFEITITSSPVISGAPGTAASPQIAGIFTCPSASLQVMGWFANYGGGTGPYLATINPMATPPIFTFSGINLPGTAGVYTFVVRAVYVDSSGFTHAAIDQVLVQVF